MSYNPFYTSPRIRTLIVQKYESKQKDEYQLALQYDRHPKTIKKYVNRYRQTNSIYSEHELLKKTSKNGIVERQKIFDDDDLRDFTLNECMTNPTQAIPYYPNHIYGEFGICISRNTVCRLFAKYGWTWKKISRIAMEVNVAEEHEFWNYVEKIMTDPRQGMWLDESYKSDTTSNPTYARGPGRVYVKVSFTRGGYKYSLLLVSWVGGVVEYQCYYGAVNQEKLIKFILERLGPYINVYPAPLSILFLDNCAVHHCRELLQIILSLGAILCYLPHYDPPLNIAEDDFKKIKAIEKKKQIYGEYEGLRSLISSVESIKNTDHTELLKEIGYI